MSTHECSVCVSSGAYNYYMYVQMANFSGTIYGRAAVCTHL